MAKQANKPLKTARRSAPPPLASAFRSVVTHASMAPGGARLLSLQQHWRLASMAMSRPTPPEFASWVVAREAAYGHKTNAPPPPRRPRPPPQHKCGDLDRPSPPHKTRNTTQAPRRRLDRRGARRAGRGGGARHGVTRPVPGHRNHPDERSCPITSGRGHGQVHQPRRERQARS